MVNFEISEAKNFKNCKKKKKKQDANFLKIFLGDIKIPIVENAPLEPTIQKFKTVVFSHGLGGTRFFYTGICCELASHGYVVIALEHRDDSPSMTYYYESEEKLKKNEPTWIKFRRVAVGTSSHLPERKNQVEMRASECRRALTLLEDLNAGKDVGNILKSDFELSQFKVSETATVSWFFNIYDYNKSFLTSLKDFL